MGLKIKPADTCKFDLVSLGECMIRLSPPAHGRIEFAPALEVWVGGGEYNVSYALCAAGPADRLGRRIEYVADGPHRRQSCPGGRDGYLARRHAKVRRRRQGRSHRPQLHRGRALETRIRNALRPRPLGDRRHEAGRSQLEEAVQEQGVRWLHTGGIFASLSDGTRRVVAEAVKAAHEAGTIVSYDLNFRSKLWSSADAIATTKPLVPYIDCLIGNEEDFQKVLGYEVEGVDVEKGKLDTSAFKSMVNRVVKDYPNIKVVGTTLRGVKTALVNDWSAIMWHDGTFYDGPSYPDLEIEDRVGGGDGFASGFAYGFLTGSRTTGLREPGRRPRCTANEHPWRHKPNYARRTDAHRRRRLSTH